MSWGKVKIGDIFKIEKGSLQSTKASPGKYTFITAAEDWKTNNTYSHDCEALIFAAAASGSLGRTHYVKGKFISSDLCFILTEKDKKDYPVDLKFYHFVFNSLRETIVKATKTGTSKEAINYTNFYNFQIDYFDIAQQHFWIDKLRYVDKAKNELLFELQKQQTYLQQLRQSILQEAVQGKLSEQLNSDEDAATLLKRIKVEKQKLIKGGKLKKEKERPPITEDEIPFELPKGWIWCRLGEVVLQSEAGKSMVCDKRPIAGNEWGIIKVSAMSWGKFDENENKVLPKGVAPFVQYKIKIGDYLISRANTAELIGKSVIVKNLKANLLLSDKSIRIKFSDPVNISYINFFNNSSIAREYYKSVATGTSDSMKNITREQMYLLPFPLPPLSEQQRIVAKVEKLQQQLNELESQVQQSREYAQQLLQAVLKEAFEEKGKVIQMEEERGWMVAEE